MWAVDDDANPTCILIPEAQRAAVCGASSVQADGKLTFPWASSGTGSKAAASRIAEAGVAHDKSKQTMKGVQTTTGDDKRIVFYVPGGSLTKVLVHVGDDRKTFEVRIVPKLPEGLKMATSENMFYVHDTTSALVHLQWVDGPGEAGTNYKTSGDLSTPPGFVVAQAFCDLPSMDARGDEAKGVEEVATTGLLTVKVPLEAAPAPVLQRAPQPGTFDAGSPPPASSQNK